MPLVTIRKKIRENKAVKSLASRLCDAGQEYGSISTIHGFRYITDPRQYSLGRYFWFLIGVVCLALTAYQIFCLHTQWTTEDLTITTLSTLNLPIDQIKFPSVTICPQGSVASIGKGIAFRHFVDWVKTKSHLAKLRTKRSSPYGWDEPWNITNENIMQDLKKFKKEFYGMEDGNPIQFTAMLNAKEPEEMMYNEALLFPNGEKYCDEFTEKELENEMNQALNEQYCPSGFSFIKGLGCVMPTNLKMTYNEALDYCNGLDEDASILSLDSSNMESTILELKENGIIDSLTKEDEMLIQERSCPATKTATSRISRRKKRNTAKKPFCVKITTGNHHAHAGNLELSINNVVQSLPKRFSVGQKVIDECFLSLDSITVKGPGYDGWTGEIIVTIDGVKKNLTCTIGCTGSKFNGWIVVDRAGDCSSGLCVPTWCLTKKSCTLIVDDSTTTSAITSTIPTTKPSQESSSSLKNKYHVDCTTRNFQDSVDYCNKSGYIIAAFHSDGDINQIKSDFVSSSCDYVYIGAIADGSGGWKWLDNSAWDWVYKQRTDLIDQRMRETRIAWAKNSDTWQDWGQGNAKMGVICQKITESTKSFTTTTIATTKTSTQLSPTRKPFCVKIITGNQKDSKGKLELLINNVEQRLPKKLHVGETVIDECFSILDSITVKGPMYDGWLGEIIVTRNGVNNDLTCIKGCTGSEFNGWIVVDGNAEGNYNSSSSTLCLNGNLCILTVDGPKLQNQGEDCWRKCNGVDGRCPFCGSEGLCCRIGNKWKRNECDGTIGGSYFHECVARPTDWCAKAYGSVRYTSWEHVLPETSRGSFFKSDKDNSVSSIKIRPGCKLEAYDDNELNNLIFAYTEDEPNLTKKSGQNDKMTSYSCTCDLQDQSTTMTTSTEITNTFSSIATTKETFSTAKDYSTSPSTPDDEKVRLWMRSKNVNNGCKAIEILKNYGSMNFNASSTQVSLDCNGKEASVICSIDQPKYSTPQTPFSKFPCTKSLSKRRDKRSEFRQSKIFKDRGEIEEAEEEEEEDESKPENLQRLDLALNPTKHDLRQKLKEKEILKYKETFGNIDLDKKYEAYFELLWYGQLPCTDVKGLTSGFKDELSFLKKCYWQGLEISCNSIFQKQPTDKGMCCSFNMEKAEKLFKPSRYTKTISERQTRDALSGFRPVEDESVPEWYKTNNEPIPEPGVQNGLTLVVDGHSDRLSSATVENDFRGFPIVVNDRNSFPSVNLNRELARPGFETDIKLSATVLEARNEIRRHSSDNRNCLFPDESFKDNGRGLKFHNNYTQFNCIFECEIDFAAKCLTQCRKSFDEKCNCSDIEDIQKINLNETTSCVPWFYPSNDKEDSGICNPWDNRKFKDIIERQIPSQLCKHCLPDCSTTRYSTTISYAKLRKCERPTTGGTNIMCRLVNDKNNPAPWINLAQNEFKRFDKRLPWFLKTSIAGHKSGIGDGIARFSNKRLRLHEDLSEELFLSEVQKNPTYDAFDDDIGIVNIYFADNTAEKFITYSKMSCFDYVTELGGSLGLFMGISVVSVIEFIYWFFFQFCAALKE